MREDRRQDPVRELAHLGRRLLRVLERLLHQQRPVLCFLRQRLLRQLERDHRVDQALLRAVMQIADDPPALVVGRRGDARARGGELSARVQVGDRGRHQLREVGEPALHAGREADARARRS